jgi:hypothetical protein
MNPRKILRRFLNENLFLSAELGGPKGGVISGRRRAQGRGEVKILRESGLAESPGPDLLMQGRVRFASCRLASYAYEESAEHHEEGRRGADLWYSIRSLVKAKFS